MFEEDESYNRKAFDDLVEEKDSIQDPDSFNKRIDSIYAEHKGKLNSEENNLLRPVSKIKNRRLNSTSPKKQIDFNNIIAKINAVLKSNKVTRSSFTKGIEGSFIKFNELKALLVNKDIQLSQTELSELFNYNNNYLAEGYILIDIFLNCLSFEEENAMMGLITESNKSKIVKEDLKEHQSSINNSQVKHDNKDIKLRFQQLNKEIKNIIVSEKLNTDSNSQTSRLIPHKNTLNRLLKVNKKNEFPLLTSSNNENKVSIISFRPLSEIKVSTKEATKVEKALKRQEFNTETVNKIREKLKKDDLFTKFINEDILKRRLFFESDCKIQIPKINLCCENLNLDQRYELDKTGSYIKITSKSGVHRCNIDYEKFKTDCKRIYKIFFNKAKTNEIHSSTLISNQKKEQKRPDKLSSTIKLSNNDSSTALDTRKENDRREFIRDTLKTSIKLKIKLKNQSNILSSKVNLNEDEIINCLNRFLQK